MKVYIARLLDDPSAGVFVWGATREAALNFLAEEDIEIDERSVALVKEAGAVLFQRHADRFPGSVEDLRYEGLPPAWTQRAKHDTDEVS